MVAKIIDITGQLLDDNLKRDLSIIMHDVFEAERQLQKWENLNQTLYGLLHEAMKQCAIVYHSDGKLEVVIDEDGIEVKEVGKCDLH
tara:strand:- start:698 stop:958 length:261 start_codon:yes stop_codon:yes gene_type:complete